ncbi:MAG TPA: hypothetical protein VN478_02295, partial [Clostridia bacterium]|nr:hypothetical protein [Clostridia bacterium]
HCFVNMEPYPTPNIWQQDVVRVLEAVDFVDEIRLGQLNYNDVAKQYPGWRAWYRQQGAAARDWCGAHGIQYDGIEARPSPRRKRRADSDTGDLFGS